MATIFDVVGAAGVLGTFYFGVRSLLQSGDFESLQKALRAYNQGLFNNIWRMGGNAEQALQAKTLEEAKLLAKGIADMSQTARHTLVAFGAEHALMKPFYEAAWKPEPLAPAPKPWYKSFFRL
jgi:hypothetical protein